MSENKIQIKLYNDLKKAQIFNMQTIKKSPYLDSNYYRFVVH